jgi:hypothetical protein
MNEMCAPDFVGDVLQMALGGNRDLLGCLMMALVCFTFDRSKGGWRLARL